LKEFLLFLVLVFRLFFFLSVQRAGRLGRVRFVLIDYEEGKRYEEGTWKGLGVGFLFFFLFLFFFRLFFILCFFTSYQGVNAL
jgi:hypothetical protein